MSIPKAISENNEKPTFRTSEELFKAFDPSEVSFVPAVPPPKKFPKIKGAGKALLNSNLEDYIKKTLSGDDFEWQNKG